MRIVPSTLAVPPVADPSRPPVHVPTVPLTSLVVGETARLLGATVDAESRSQLKALGLTDGCLLRVCKQGEPCVVQVRATRIGISSRIAQHVQVAPERRD